MANEPPEGTAPKRPLIGPAGRARLWGFFVPALIVGVWFALSRSLEDVAQKGEDRLWAFVVPGLVVLIAAGTVAAIVSIRKRPQVPPAARSPAPGRTRLGQGYVLDALTPESFQWRKRLTMRFTADAIEITRERVLEYVVERSVPLRAIRAVLDRPPAIVVVYGGGDSGIPETRLPIVPGSYADRQRMLWEFAVRVPDAVERGIGTSATPREPTGTGRTLPPTGPLRGTPAPAAGAGLTGMDDAMASLGSALVTGDSQRPAPPRSGLGVGLFAAPPSDNES